MDTKKVVTLAAIGVALYFVISDPQGSAGAVENAMLWLQGVAQSLIAFLRNLFQ
ncbi:hypothetical protein A8924_1968 [Saccharopolyspora erythraea NRRL 2338]|uniref:Uncharacterized protein n=2 Tax=Saccharopolyspora erythraea TaxID=1836 RepID=A4FA15_SACEN|nr:hypothetical protein [Saccharopolyspora erythraea]EQD85666.1 hypothetical protein N599_13795 [Saccharopolyspora erythraea D]PFG94675.1 hypothetical protein A8924_1968 [Saccharopolyspora erythraea NRRL 2338]QRK91405.1 hypothetical protein JQX30_08405 [Saccharopolyspora erythraea]QUH01136.1 hypothetical protein HUO13_10225 [Saccharopolyspora erythraea]CAM00890.1 hypothetical protein SACE_1568 [Saccharopolyspora erythraea NRRL 2338]